MAQTTVKSGSSLAVQRYSNLVATDIARNAYWNSKFMEAGPVPTRPIWRITDLENQRGESVKFNLSVQLRGKPVQGGTLAEGTGEKLDLFTDTVFIDQVRKVVDTGGSMDQKRTVVELRQIGRARQSDYWTRLFDETISMYLSGARGTNDDFIEDTTFTGYAQNALVAPDSKHLLYAGDATSAASMVASDVFDLKVLDKAIAKAKRQGGGTQRIPKLQAAKVGGKKQYLCVIDPIQEFNLRRKTGDAEWAAINKALATALGNKSAFVEDSIGIYRDTVVHVHEATIRFNNYGATSNLNAARALFCGVQAGVLILGQPGKALTFDWEERLYDFNDKMEICCGTKWGFKKTTFAGYDFGVFALDSAANPADVGN